VVFAAAKKFGDLSVEAFRAFVVKDAPLRGNDMPCSSEREAQGSASPLLAAI